MGRVLHPTLAAGRWFELTLMEQLGNIGCEVGRATRAKAQGNEQRLAGALESAERPALGPPDMPRHPPGEPVIGRWISST
jgi:hypothetical protein